MRVEATKRPNEALQISETSSQKLRTQQAPVSLPDRPASAPPGQIEHDLVDHRLVNPAR